MFIPEFPTQTHVFFWREIEALRSLGAEVQIISTRPPADSCPHEFARIATAQTHYVYPPSLSVTLRSIFRPYQFISGLRYIASLSETARGKARMMGYLLCAADLAYFSRAQKLDHIHVHSCADAAHVVAMAKLLGGAPYSLHLHGDLPVYGANHMQKMQQASFVAAAARPMQRQVIEEIGIRKEKTYTMWMGVDTVRFNPPSRSRRRKEFLHLVMISRLHLCKGHRYMLMALRKLLDLGLDIRLTIAGSGPHENEIVASVSAGNFGDRVKMVGSLSESGVRNLVLGADVFVLSSVGLGEASPVAVMEAMATGVPVISSIIGGTPDMITDGVDGLLVAQEDIDGLVEAVRRIYDDEDFRERLGAAARLRACNQFDSQVMAKKLIEVIMNTRECVAPD